MDERVHLALWIVQLNFSIGAIVANVGSINPVTFAVIRETAAGGILYVVSTRFTGINGPQIRDWCRFARIGGCVAATQLLGIVGLKFASPVAFAIWQPTQPALVSAVSVCVGWERPKALRFAGIACAAAGCLVVAGRAERAEISAHLCFAASCVAGAAYQILVKTVVHRYPPICVASWCYCVAAVLTVALAALFSSSEGWVVPVAAVPALLWWIFASTVLNYGLQVWAIKHSSPTLVTSYAALQPVLTAALTLALIFLLPNLGCEVEPSSSGRRSRTTGCLVAPGATEALGGTLVLSGLALTVMTEGDAVLEAGAAAAAANDNNKDNPPLPPEKTLTNNNN
ncbi:hypothetical protein CTAYLR_009963 [Chrysophaeum taylorii]|uniref:EamA domain-containing protein n=1 Tax=Chrysophaeum taylorii TaxID=2483200 RepID=A0AAD7U5Z5_9STRA|nr:hypothetical protein CTAYLR_009963 [Chrysophaeum taylorii]